MPQFFAFLMVFAVLGELGRHRRPPDPPKEPYQPKSGFRIERAALARLREWRSKVKLPALSWLPRVRAWLTATGDRWKVALAKWWDRK